MNISPTPCARRKTLLSRVRPVRAGIVAVAIAALVASVATPAEATYVRWPSRASGVWMAAHTAHSFSIGLASAANASHYELSASTVKSDIYVVNINRRSSHRVTARSTRPHLTVRNLAYTSSPYYYRVATVNGPHVRWSSAYHIAYLYGASSTSGSSTLRWPGVVSDVRIAAQTPTSFTVAVDATTNVSRYQVSASTVASDIWVVNIDKSSPHRVVASSSTPRITVANLPHTADPFYYRVATINGTHVRWSSAFHQTYVAPYTPTSLTATAGAGGTYLSWDPTAATGFTIEQAEDASFTAGRHVYTTRNGTSRFTPYDLRKGKRYWFRVTALNGTTASATSGVVSATPTTSEQSLRVLTYNTLSTSYDGSSKGGTTQAPWAQRLPGVVKLLKQSKADVITVQEDGAYVHQRPWIRQVDTITTGLGSPYATANTDHGPNVGAAPNSPLTGNYIIYNRNRVTPIGTGGHFYLGDKTYAAYQLFRVNGTGAKFLYTGMHLAWQSGPSYDVQRRNEISALLSQGQAVAKRGGVTSVLYAGDTNSFPNRWESTDEPGIVMQNNDVSDSFEAAQSLTNPQYSSINNYWRKAALGGSADRVFATGGVAVRDWGQLLDLTNGQFVGVIPSDHNPVYADIELPY